MSSAACGRRHLVRLEEAEASGAGT